MYRCIYLLLAISFLTKALQSPEFQWQYVNFTWTSEAAYNNAINKKLYIPENVELTGMKFYKDYLYLSTPQIRKGVPVTLGRISVRDERFNPLISPYPSWEMNIGKNCNTLQSIQSMEIDNDGIMWVLDGVRINNNTKCPPKLVFLDLNNGGKLVLSHIFPNDVSLWHGGFINDIVIDETDGGYAYISDASSIDPGLIVYSRKENRSWKLRDRSMLGDPKAAGFFANNLTNSNIVPINGIALSPNRPYRERKVFYCALTSYNLYSISTRFLKQINTNSSRGIKWVGRKPSPSDGLIIDNFGNLYSTLLTLNGVGKWNINSPFHTKVLLEDESIQWPSTFAFNVKGNLRILSNNGNKFSNLTYPLPLVLDGKVKFRIFKIFTGSQSYLH